MQVSRSTDDRSIGELLGDLARETTTLVRQEVRLATTEMSQKATRVGKDVGFLAIGGAVAYAGFLVLLAAVTIMLAGLMPLWLSALLVGIVVAAIGGFLVGRGMNNLKHLDLAPHETIETLHEDKRWAKEQLR